MYQHLISLMIVLPFLGALLQALLPERSSARGGRAAIPLGRFAALVASLLASLCGISLVISMRTSTPDLQASEVVSWIGSYAIHYDMGVDGLNAPLVLLVCILFPILIASEWNRKVGVRGMHGLFLILQTSLIGAVCAQDIFLLFFFWALSAFPLYFMIGIWGGQGRESAAFRSMVSTSVGIALLFGALLLIYYSVDPHSFSLRELAGGKLTGKTFDFLGSQFSVPIVTFILIGAGLALRAPIWPFHGWFTHVSEEAPPTVVVAIAAITVPVATYIFERLTYTLFPETLGTFSFIIVIVGSINLLMGAICAVAQRDLRSLVSFICLGQVGIVLIGIGSLSSAGFVGAVYEQLVMGLGLAGFGLFSNLLIERSGRSWFRQEGGERAFGGVAAQAPSMAMVAGIVVASLLGFPGLGGFVGNSLIVIGSFAAHPVAVLVAGASILMAAYYLFTMYRYVFLGSPAGAHRSEIQGGAQFTDLTLRERLYLAPLVASLLFFGLYPKPLIELVRPTVLTLLSTIK